MARLEPAAAELKTLWRCPDDLWHGFAAPLIRELDPEPRTGRPRVDPRKAFDGMVYHLRTGCQWEALPREFGSRSSVHRTFQRWVALGLFERLWAALVEYARRLGLVDWDWQASDTAMGKARHGGARAARTRRTGRSPARSGRR
jgi:putative transposase